MAKLKELEKGVNFAYFDKPPVSATKKQAEDFEPGFYVVESDDPDGHDTNPTLGAKLVFTDDEPDWPVYEDSVKAAQKAEEE